jgi:hypothetical protein
VAAPVAGGASGGGGAARVDWSGGEVREIPGSGASRQWAVAPGGAGGGARRDITGEGGSRLRGTVCDTDWTGSKRGTVRSSPAAR